MRDLYLVALVVLAGLAGTVVQSPQESKGSLAKTAASRTPNAAPKGPWAVICDSLSPAPCGGKQNVRSELWPNAQAKAPFSVNVIIAFVPDPERTNLPLYFDRSLEALQNAAGDEDYRFLDYWLPWPTSPVPEYESRDDRQAEKDARDANRKLPGALVFQGPTGYPGLVIFLVGDRPSAGYSADQFNAAINYEKMLSTDGAPLEIVGPDFSGSLGLLSQALTSQVPDRKVVVHSGTATSSPALNALQSDLDQRGNGSIADSYLACDNETRRWLSRFLEERLRAKRPYSILHESRTLFGSAYSKSDANGSCAADSTAEDKDASAFINYSFPPGLSYIRKAYGKTRTGEAPDSSEVSALSRPSLQLDLSASEQGQDQQPEFSSATPVSHDAELAAATESLQHDHIQYAGVVATDPLDTLFVASYLRSTVPDTRLVFMDSDVVDALPGNDISLEGSLLVSSYPVFFEAQGWYKEKRPQARSIFSSQFEEGVYNATRALFHEQDSKLFDPEREHPEHSSLLRRPIEPTRLWLSIIGRDGLWPVSVQEDYAGEADAHGFGWFWPPRIWFALAFASLLGLGFFFVIFTWRPGEQPDQWCADFSLHHSRGNLAARGAYITGICVSAIGCWLAATGGQVGLFVEAPELYWFGGRAVLIVAAVMLAFAVWISLWTRRQFVSPDPGPRLAAQLSGRDYLRYLLLPWIVLLSYAAALAWTAETLPPIKKATSSSRCGP